MAEAPFGGDLVVPGDQVHERVAQHACSDLVEAARSQGVPRLQEDDHGLPGKIGQHRVDGGRAGSTVASHPWIEGEVPLRLRCDRLRADQDGLPSSHDCSSRDRNVASASPAGRGRMSRARCGIPSAPRAAMRCTAALAPPGSPRTSGPAGPPRNRWTAARRRDWGGSSRRAARLAESAARKAAARWMARMTPSASAS